MAEREPRWLLLVHQIPSEPSKLRVKIWRRLQAVGAVAVKSSVYVLPSSAEAREDFEWLRGEVVALGGEAVVFTADAVDEASTDEIVEAFRAARQADWRELRERAASVLGAGGSERPPPEEERRRELRRELGQLRGRIAQVDRIDFFQAPARREAVAAVEALEAALEPAARGREGSPAAHGAELTGRRWLTRPRPGVDRMASAWLIRTFIDREAEFELAERIAPEGDAIPFDMFGVELGHHGDACTFETLLDRFGLREPVLARLARIVHDLDLRSGEPADAETATVGALVDGLRRAFPDDRELLEHGMALFAALYESFGQRSP